MTAVEEMNLLNNKIAAQNPIRILMESHIEKCKTFNIDIGEKFLHYKGGKYIIKGFALNENNLEILILYGHVGDESPILWSRTFEDFTSDVTLNDGKIIKRFTHY